MLIEWQKNEKGGFVPVEVPGSEKVYPAQLVLIAMGFTGPENTVLDQLGVVKDERSNAKADYGKFATSVDGSSLPVTCVVGKALWFGRSMKVAQRLVKLIVT